MIENFQHDYALLAITIKVKILVKFIYICINFLMFDNLVVIANEQNLKKNV